MSRRIRPRLLILLWVWGILMFVVVDLFRNVPELDHVRPDSSTYRAMRYAAHRLAGEPYLDGDFVTATDPLPPRHETLRNALAAVERETSFEGMRGWARGGGEDPDPRVRIRAFRLLAERFGEAAAPTLLDLARDGAGTMKIRAQAARYLARTGPGSLAALESLVRTEPDAVREGAMQGMGELGTRQAAQGLLHHARSGDGAVRRAALRALGRVAGPDAAPLLAEAAEDRGQRSALRAAACTALGRTRSADAAAALARVLADRSHPPVVRAAAARALGRAGCVDALETVRGACADPVAIVAREARLARQRLGHLAE